MNKEIKELFNKYGVKDLKNKNGQSECFYCKNIKHKFSLTWTSFLYEYKGDYYCFDCLLIILLQKENEKLNHYKLLYQKVKERNDKAIEFVEEFIREDYYEKLDEYITHFTWNKTKEDLLEILKGNNEVSNDNN